MQRSRLIRSAFFLLILFAAFPVAAQVPARIWGELSLYPYLDRVKNDVDMTVTINGRITDRLSYFSYNNFRGVLSSGDVFLDRSEQNLRWAMWDDSPLDLSLQSVIVKGEGNDQWQLGLSWRLNDTSFLKQYFEFLNLRYRMTFQLKRFASFDEDALVMQHFFKTRFPRKSERFYLSGFLTQTFNSELSNTNSSNPFVTEIQFGARIFGNFNAIMEYRINQYRISENHNFAAGIEYSFRW